MKKIKYKYLIVFVLFISLINTSCNKATLLDITPTDRYTQNKVV